MSKLSTQARKHLKAAVFALSGRRFPVNDVSHAEAAIRMAPRSEHAGNITDSERAHVVTVAKRFLARHGHPQDSTKNKVKAYRP